METIKEVIQQKLQEIEEKEDVCILYAVESGSRAWGFESPDSDYDVRFIYVRKREDYLLLEQKRDVIEWQLLVIKKQQGEKAKGKAIPMIQEYITSKIEELKIYLDGMEDDRKREWGGLDLLFRELVQ